MFHPRTPSAAHRAFTLIEMIVVVVIVGLLTATAAVGYDKFIGQARDDRVRLQLHHLSILAQAYAMENDIIEVVSHDMFVGALGSFPDVVATPGTTAAGAGWSIVPGTQVPADEYQFSIAFDDGIGSSIGDVAGTRAAVVTRSETGHLFGQLLLAAPEGSEKLTTTYFPLPDGASAADVLGGTVTPDSTLPYSGATATPTDTSTTPASTPTPSPTTDSATPVADTTTADPTPTPDPVTDPVTVTPHPDTDWSTCTAAVTGTPDSTVTNAEISTHGNSTVWWSVADPTPHIAGFKVCASRDGAAPELVAATGPGTGDARSWVVRTNLAHPDLYVSVVTVMDDGREFLAANQCEVRPAGKANGWGATCS